MKCADYNKERLLDEQASDIMLMWAQGFLTGVNIAEFRAGDRDLAPLPDSELVEKFVNRWCVENPSSSAMEGLADLPSIMRNEQPSVTE